MQEADMKNGVQFAPAFNPIFDKKMRLVYLLAERGASLSDVQAVADTEASTQRGLASRCVRV